MIRPSKFGGASTHAFQIGANAGFKAVGAGSSRHRFLNF